MKRVGLTGGIGCGKSTVVAEMRRQGVSCFVADEVAARYYDDPLFVAEVAKSLRMNVCSSDGMVDKRAIADAVFHDKEKLARLNSLIHPRVMADYHRWLDNHADEDLTVFECAILYEYELDKQVDVVVTVYLDEEERMRRLALRDRVSRQELELRMRNQISAEEKMLRADYVILNYEGNPRERQVKEILNEIKLIDIHK